MDLSAKLRKLNYLFYYLKQYFNQTQLTLIYLALYQPVLMYGIIHWGNAANCHTSPIWFLQKSLLKKLNFGGQSFQEEKLLTLQKLYAVQLLTYVLKNKSKFDISIRAGITRHSGKEKASIPSYCKYHVRRQARYMGAILFNRLPETLKTNFIQYKYKRKALIKFILDTNIY